MKLPSALKELAEWQKPRARGKRRHTPGVMNKTEAAYAEVLDASYRTNAIAWYGFEAITLKLGPDCRWTPDFLVIDMDGYIEFHEVKAGYVNASGKVVARVEDDAAVKLRLAPGQFPFFRFRLAWLYRGTWEWRDIG